MTPFKPRLFTPLDTLTAFLVPVVVTAIMAWAQVTPGNDPSQLAVGWCVIVFFWAIPAVHFWNKQKLLAVYQMVSKQGVILGARGCQPDWTGTDEVIEAAIAALRTMYPDAAKVLVGTEVVFVPTPFECFGRAVVGAQQGFSVEVTYKPKMADSALGHELGHVVLQYRAGDPPEAEAHRILAALGL